MEQNEEKKSGKLHNILPYHGNEASMNLNPLILANIQGSSYFKVHLFKLKTYHEVVDEIYYQVKHLEPWERGSRKTSGQTGMCGGVRGVGAGGIVSTAYCLLYKLYTLRLTRKQVNGLMTHTDSPFIRALGFMYIRYTQPPGDLYDWYEEYLQDEEEIDVKAGGGQVVTIGQMLYQWLTKLDWFSTLFPRIPVPIQKQIERKLNEYQQQYNVSFAGRSNVVEAHPTPARNTANREQADRTYDRQQTSYPNNSQQSSRSWEKDREKTRERRDRDDKYKRKDDFDDRRRGDRNNKDRRDDRDNAYASHRSSRTDRRSENEVSHRRSRSRSTERAHSSRPDKHRSREKETKSSHRGSSRDYSDNYGSHSRDRESRYN